MRKNYPLSAAGTLQSVPQPTLRLTARALLEVKRLSDPQIHPDGQRVAFVVQESEFEQSRWTSHIWITEWMPSEQSDDSLEAENTDGSVATAQTSAPAAEAKTANPEDLTRQLTFSVEGESDPLWSPDGQHLAFLSMRPDPSESSEDADEDEEPVYQIWILPIDGGEARRVTETKEGILDYAWSPDSESLVYLTPEPRPRPLESLHKERERHKFDPVVEQEDRRRRQVWRVDVGEGKPKLLFTGDLGIESFALSPQGDRLAYLTNYTGEDNDYHISDLYVRQLETGATVKLIRREGGKYRLRWSPDGRQIAFLSWFDPKLSYSRESLYVADVQDDIWEDAAAPPVRDEINKSEIENRKSKIESPGVTECRLLSDLDFDITAFEWRIEPAADPESAEDSSLPAPNGAFALAAARTGSDLYHLTADVTTALLDSGSSAPAGNENNPPSLKIRGRARSEGQDLPLSQNWERGPGGKGPVERRDLAAHAEQDLCAYVQEDAAAFPEIYLRDAEGDTHQLTRLNAHLTETYRLPEQKVVSWQSADGMTIEGVLTYPLDYVEGTRYPLVVQVHGGPKGRATNTLRDYTMSPLWASEGYIVLRPNFRGSEGYGNAFAVANRRDLGGGDFADIMAGVDWCIAEGLADPERMGIMGGSYGGYMTNWAIGHTDRFAGAVSMFGIFHLQTDYSNSSLSRWEHDYIGAFYWEDPEAYQHLSPGSYLKDIKTPVLILHGDDDDNTSLTNSREMYQALRQRGVVTQFVHYPREGHGLREPNHRLDEMRRCLAWMDRYVRNGGRTSQVFRAGDKVHSSDGRFELCVTRVEVGSFIGEARPEHEADATVLLEVAFTLHRIAPDSNSSPCDLHLAAVGLEIGSGEILRPAGVPMEAHGTKVLLEGEHLRVTQFPDKETGELAFALAVVFRVPKRGGEGQIRIGEFPPVAVAWTVEADEAEAAGY